MVASARDHGDRLLVRFEGLEDRTAVEAVRGTVLIADVDPAERLFSETEDEFYDRQLVGLRVREMRRRTGPGRRGSCTPEQDLLEVQTATGVRLVPFVAALVPEVDLAAGIVTVAEVAGLFDDEPDT